MTFRALGIVVFGLIVAIGFGEPAGKESGAKKMSFGKTKDGQAVDLYTLTNANGVVVTITNYGGTVVSLKTPDRHGKFADLVLGFDNLDGYLGEEPFFGALVGRYGNRIAYSGRDLRFASNSAESIEASVLSQAEQILSARPKGNSL